MRFSICPGPGAPGDLANLELFSEKAMPNFTRVPHLVGEA